MCTAKFFFFGKVDKVIVANLFNKPLSSKEISTLC